MTETEGGGSQGLSSAVAPNNINEILKTCLVVHAAMGCS